MLSTAHEQASQIHQHLELMLRKCDELMLDIRWRAGLMTPDFSAALADADNAIAEAQVAYYDALLELGVRDWLASKVSEEWVLGRYDSDPNRRKDRRWPYSLFNIYFSVMFVVVSSEAPTKNGFEYEDRLHSATGRSPVMYHRLAELSEKSRRTGRAYWRHAQTSRVLVKGFVIP